MPSSYSRCRPQHGARREHAEPLDAGKNTRPDRLRVEVRGLVLLVQLVELRAERASRLNAWITAMPASDSAIWAVTAAMRLRTSPNAAGERTGTSARTSSAGGNHAASRAPSRQSTSEQRDDRPTNVSVLAMSVFRPSESTSESASTSLVRRAMIQPAALREVAQRQGRQVPEQVLAQLEHDALADAARPRITNEPRAQEAALMAT